MKVQPFTGAQVTSAILSPCDAHIAVLTQQVTNYHAARYKAARSVFRRLSVLSVLNSADFNEFLAEDGYEGRETRICAGEADYVRAITDGSLWRRIHHALDHIRPDVVAVAGWSFPESLAAIAWARAFGASVVVMSASQAADSTRFPWREWIKSRVVKACDAALVAAERHKSYVIALGLPPDRIFLGYDAVDNAHFEAGTEAARAEAPRYRARAGLPERYLLASGRFIPKKNYPRLIKAFASAIARVDMGHHLVILGDGPERDQIEAAIKESGLDSRIHLPGFVTYERLPVYYGLSEGFLHVSLSEQWGLVVNEAAAAGVPLVVSHPCGAAESLVFPGRNGTIVDPCNEAEIADAIANLMTLAAETRAAMGKASRQIVADWGPERFAAGLANAARVALTGPWHRLATLDGLLFRALARMRISKVS